MGKKHKKSHSSISNKKIAPNAQSSSSTATSRASESTRTTIVAENKDKTNIVETIKECQPKGLQNIGNTCYFNSILQAIACSRRYIQIKITQLTNSSVPVGHITYALYHTLVNLKNNSKNDVPLTKSTAKSSSRYQSVSLAHNPSSLLQSIVSQNVQFQGRNQQDSHELYVCLMDSLKEEYDKSLKLYREDQDSITAHSSSNQTDPDDSMKEEQISTETSSQISQLNDSNRMQTSDGKDFATPTIEETFKCLSSAYSGKLISRITCKSCERKFLTLEGFFDISLSIPGSESLMVLPLRYRLPSKTKKKDNVSMTPTVEASKKSNVEGECLSNDIEGSDGMTKVVESVEAMNINDDESQTTTNADAADDSSNDKEEQKAQDNPSISNIERKAILCYEDIIEPDIPSDSIRGKYISLYDCLDLYVMEESLSLSSNNGFNCEYCNRTTDGVKRLYPLDLPRCFVLHLKRLLPGGKYDQHISFPLMLDMSKYIATRKTEMKQSTQETSDHELESQKILTDPQIPLTIDEIANNPTSTDQAIEPSESRVIDDQSNAKEEPQVNQNMYHLVSVVVHQGSSRGGHYIAYVRCKGQWYYTSDSTVMKSSERDVLACQAYMLFYAR